MGQKWDVWWTLELLSDRWGFQIQWSNGLSAGNVLAMQDTLWLCQNSYWKWPFIVDLPIKKWWFSRAMLVQPTSRQNARLGSKETSRLCRSLRRRSASSSAICARFCKLFTFLFSSLFWSFFTIFFAVQIHGHDDEPNCSAGSCRMQRRFRECRGKLCFSSN